MSPNLLESYSDLVQVLIRAACDFREKNPDKLFRVHLSGNANHMPILEAELANNIECFPRDGVCFIQTLSLGSAWIKITSWAFVETCFLGPGTRKVPPERIRFMNMHLDRWPHYMMSESGKAHVAVQQCSSFENDIATAGLDAGLSVTAFNAANVRIVVANNNMPTFSIIPLPDAHVQSPSGVFFSGCPIKASGVHYVLEVDEPLVEHAENNPTPTSNRIAELVMRSGIIRPGALLQVGIGSTPSSVVPAIVNAGINDLGIHTEVLGDALLQLIKNGLITNKSKEPPFKGKSVTGFVLGSRNLYDWLNQNDAICFLPIEVVNDIRVLTPSFHKPFSAPVISLNTALSCSLRGAVSGYARGQKGFPATEIYSGPGGGGNFNHIATRTGGTPLILMESTFTCGNEELRSRITAENFPFSSIRAEDAFVLVTEYGIADLRQKSSDERVVAIINCAHPMFRGELFDTIKKVPGFEHLSVHLIREW